MQIAELLANFRQIAQTPKEQGDLFEELVAKILRRSPEYPQIERVLFWKDWEKTKNIADIGIDLVVETRDGEFWAVQCKFYDSNSAIPKEEIDSFLAAAGRDYSGKKFSRLLLYTTAPLSANARKEIEDRTPPAVLRRVDMFDDALYDWERLYDVLKNRTDSDFLRPKKSLRPHQLAALDAVKSGFESTDRGKLIMACGTGKTLTSLRITEAVAPDAGLVLYLVPSLTLLAQTLGEWTRESNRPLAPIIVCSDAQIHRQDARRNAALVGKAKSKSKKQETSESDEPEFDPVQFSHPATTKPEIVAERWQKIRESQETPLTVVFSTYQSIQAISDAQKIGLPAFDLIVCDEAHRTTGVTLGTDDESAFVKVHDDNVIKGKKRLYMTATPRVYGDFARQKVKEQKAELCSMDDEALYGKDFFTLSFGDAVQQGLLADYKVSILVVGEDYARKYLSQCQTVSEVAESGELKRADAGRDLDVDDVAKMIGCWRGLNKQSKFDGAPARDDDFAADPAPMRRAVAFCRSIKDSKEFARAFKILGDKLLEEERAAQFADEDAAASKRAEDAERREAFLTHSGRSTAEEKSAESERVADVANFAPKRPASVEIETEHVDGTFPADEREKLLRWLREDSDKNACRVLSNVRCLSEGVDVPNLDAALFLSPRASQVDVVQAVGRVMRLAPGKKFGYVVIPIVIAENVDPEEALDDNERYRVVWQTLQAIRSHDDRFRVLINQLQVGEKSSKLHVQVVGKGGGTDGGAAQTTIQTDGDKKNEKTSKGKEKAQESSRYFPGFFDSVHPIEKAIRARVVKKCGDRNYLDQWARDVAKITAGRIDGIRARLENPTSAQEAAFNSLLAALRREINPNVDKEQALDMVAQHLTTLPVFDALFPDSAFSRNNPVAKRIQATVDAFNLSLTPEEQAQERRFQEDVRAQIDGIRTARGRQAVIHKLYEQFFSVALPKMAEKLGVVYTPPEVVDYILRSVDYVLQQEFGRRLTNKDVHILDPFTGTGAFISRLLESGLIDQNDLQRKYREELHANEIMPLAYYIAAVNIEEAYCAASGDSVEYEPFPGVVLTDTFQTTETMSEPIYKLACDNPTNGKRLKKQRHTTIQVIVGNPPYSIGQKSVNDNNQNEKYPKLDARVAETYAAKSNATQKKSLYDSYIKAFRWASDRIVGQGIIAFVSNGAYIDNAAMEGFRKSLVEEFSSLYVFNLRGNQRTQGELSRKEGGKIFGSGARTSVAITILVKKPYAGDSKLFYRDIGDFLTREQKLLIIRGLGSVEKTEWKEITPNKFGDWINQRGSNYEKLIPLDSKGLKDNTVKFFDFRSCGVLTARDAWVWNFSQRELLKNLSQTTSFYNNQVNAYLNQTRESNPNNVVCQDLRKISWSTGLLNNLKSGKYFEEEIESSLRIGTYRPFCKEFLFFNRIFNERPSQNLKLFPLPSSKNMVICTPGAGINKSFCTIIVDKISDLQLMANGQCFPRYYYEPLENSTLLPSEEQVISDGYVRRDAITDGILAKARDLYGKKVDKDDIFFYVYGALHSTSYRERYANDLKKELARLPLPSPGVFWQCSAIGRELADVHLNYESGKSTIGDREGKPFKKLSPVSLRIDQTAPSGLSDAALYRVDKKMRLGATTERQEDGTTRKVFDGTLKYNDYLKIHGIPLESFKYVVNGRSPLEWLVERYYCKEDKASGIVDDPNEWSDDPRYIFDLIPRLVAVSLRTLELTSQLPDLE